MSKVAVVGAGAWGTALAIHAVRAGNHVALVARDTISACEIKTNRESRRLPGFRLPDALDLCHEVPDDADLLLWVVPTQCLRMSLSKLTPTNAGIVVCCKGVEAQTSMFPLEVANEASRGCRLALLTGPNFAHEIAAALPAAAVVASEDTSLSLRIRTTLGTPSFRLYGNDDLIGTQLGGAAKNVIAIAAGAVIGAGLGENARAALVTRGLSEMSRLAVFLGGRADTLMGLSGLGDLLLTCAGPTSRNFSLGHALGRGNDLYYILANRSGVTEGVSTAAALIARAGVLDLPICQAVADLLAGIITVDTAIVRLLSRPQRDE